MKKSNNTRNRQAKQDQKLRKQQLAAANRTKQELERVERIKRERDWKDSLNRKHYNQSLVVQGSQRRSDCPPVLVDGFNPLDAMAIGMFGFFGKYEQALLRRRRITTNRPALITEGPTNYSEHRATEETKQLETNFGRTINLIDHIE